VRVRRPVDRQELRQAGHQAAQEAGRFKEIGGSGAHLNPLGLFLRTSITFIWRILSACLPA
jgi:hypothetical protein